MSWCHLHPSNEKQLNIWDLRRRNQSFLMRQELSLYEMALRWRSEMVVLPEMVLWDGSTPWDGVTLWGAITTSKHLNASPTGSNPRGLGTWKFPRKRIILPRPQSWQLYFFLLFAIILSKFQILSSKLLQNGSIVSRKKHNVWLTRGKKPVAGIIPIMKVFSVNVRNYRFCAPSFRADSLN